MPLEELTKTPPAPRPTECRVCWAMNLMPTTLANNLTAALKVPSLSMTVIAADEDLTDWDLSDHQLRRHARGGCKARQRLR